MADDLRSISTVVATGGRYAAFISYSHRDDEIGEWLHKRLESYRVPSPLVGREGPSGPIGNKLGKVFRDRADLSAAHDLGAEINAALARADALIVLCSPRSCGSRYVEAEIRAFKQLGKSDRIFAAIVDGEPHAAGKPGRSAADECFPRALIYRLAADGSVSNQPESTEPIAADFRDDRDGRENGSLKLIAGLLGVPLDELVQREKQAERRRRLRANAIAASMSALAIAALCAGGYALLQRSSAVHNLTLAVEARDVAEKQRQRARTAQGVAEENERQATLNLAAAFAARARTEIAAANYLLASRYALAGDTIASGESGESIDAMRTVLARLQGQRRLSSGLALTANGDWSRLASCHSGNLVVQKTQDARVIFMKRSDACGRGWQANSLSFFSQDGSRLILTDGGSRRIEVRDAQDGRLISNVSTEDAGSVGEVSPDGRYALLGTLQAASLVSLDDGRTIASYNCGLSVERFRTSSQLGLLRCFGPDFYGLHVIEMDTGAIVRSIEGTWNDVRFAPTSPLMLACDPIGPIKVFNLRGGADHELGPSDGCANRAIFVTDTRVAWGDKTSHGTVQFFMRDIGSDAPVQSSEASELRGLHQLVAFSDGAGMIAREGNEVAVWQFDHESVDTRSVGGRFARLGASYTPGGRYLVWNGDAIVDLNSRMTPIPTGSAANVAFGSSADGRTVFVIQDGLALSHAHAPAQQFDEISAFSLAERHQVAHGMYDLRVSFLDESGHADLFETGDQRLNSASYSQDGSRLMAVWAQSSQSEPRITLFDPRRSRTLANQTVPGPLRTVAIGRRNDRAVLHFATSLSGTNDELWDLTSMRRLASFPAQLPSIFTGDGRYLLSPSSTAGDGRQARLLSVDTATGRIARMNLRTTSRSSAIIKLAANSSRVALAYTDDGIRQIYFVDLAQGRQYARWTGAQILLAMDNTGQRFIVRDSDVFRVLSVGANIELTSFDAPADCGGFSIGAFFPDNRRVLIICSSGWRVVDAQTGRILAERDENMRVMNIHRQEIQFDPNGDTFGFLSGGELVVRNVSNTRGQSSVIRRNLCSNYLFGAQSRFSDSEMAADALLHGVWRRRAATDQDVCASYRPA